MASAGRDGDERATERPPRPTSRSERQAEALRANLRRRKAQLRARDETRPDEPDRES